MVCGGESKDKAVPRKVVIVGDGGCGKTSLLNVFARGYFPGLYEPAIFDNHVKDVQVDGRTVELAMWDTAGQEDFKRIRSLAYEDTHVFMICFSVDSRDSLDNITEHWIHEVQGHTPNAKFVLIALKCDLRDDKAALVKQGGDEPILYDEGLAVARMIHAMSYVECSAKHNRGVQMCFEQVARIAMRVRLKKERKKPAGMCVIL
ncbi:small GTPase superfamily [Syncephalastrum racemosum]|uniref:Small GTPase superfamily n=1 Tax=Syncephalastrum racemosum TaxID=13706 RepID=A0A1X2H0C5_SYNRA|nr:small GTPase superfamily [Syncephalastrum racemosum]